MQHVEILESRHLPAIDLALAPATDKTKIMQNFKWSLHVCPNMDG